jgi:hypothetical protein
LLLFSFALLISLDNDIQVVLLLDKDASHLPGSHLPEVSDGVVVPLDGVQPGVEGEEGGGQQTLVLNTRQSFKGFVTLEQREGHPRRVLNDLLRTRLSRRRNIWLFPYSSPVSKLDRRYTGRLRK